MPIRFYSFSMQLMALIALISGAVSFYLYREVLREARRVQVSIATIPRGTGYFALTTAGDVKRCFGEINSYTTEDGGQFSVTYTAWLAAHIGSNKNIYEASGHLIFNPLGQLGGALLKTTVNGAAVRLGAVNINPITVMLAVGPEGSGPLIKQNIPGPITANIQGENLVIRAPAFKDRSAPPTTLQLAAGLPKLELISSRCNRAAHEHLRISEEALLQITGSAPHFFPGGLL